MYVYFKVHVQCTHKNMIKYICYLKERKKERKKERQTPETMEK